MPVYKIAILSGDGIGGEVIEQATKVLHAIGNMFNYDFVFEKGLIGGKALEVTGKPLPKETLELCKLSHAVLVGAVGFPKWDEEPRERRPEIGLLSLRSELNLYSNLRHGKIFPSLRNVSPLKSELLINDVDIIIVRELTGGIYFGDRGTGFNDSEEYAYDTERYSYDEIERIAKVAFNISRERKMKVHSVDKANILETSRLWRKVVSSLSESYPDIELQHMYADNAAMQLIKYPNRFNVILTSNLFGDILSDEMSMIIGSIGLLPSASIGEGTFGLYEPSHGSAPYMTNKNIANPLAAILSASMMLKFSLNLHDASLVVENAISKVLGDGYRTKDIYRCQTDFLVGTKEMGELICKEIKEFKH